MSNLRVACSRCTGHNPNPNRTLFLGRDEGWRTERDVQVARGVQQECADHDRGEAAHLGHHLRPRLRLLRK